MEMFKLLSSVQELQDYWQQEELCRRCQTAQYGECNIWKNDVMYNFELGNKGEGQVLPAELLIVNKVLIEVQLTVAL